MAETQCVLIKIKDGKTDKVLEWINGLKNNKQAREIVKAEGIIVESIFFYQGADGDYLVLYQKVESLVKAYEIFNQSTNPINVETKQLISETWGEIKPLDLLIDFELYDEK